MKLAVFGATGYLGTVFCKFALQHFAVRKLYLFSRRVHPGLTQHGKLEQLIFKEGFSKDLILSAIGQLLGRAEVDALVYIAAVSAPTDCERHPELSWFLNYELFAEVSKFLNQAKISGYYVSTDLVFDGSQAPAGGFVELSSPNPISVYGKSKFAAEQLLRESQLGAILRSSLIYGPRLAHTGGNLAWMIDSLDRGGPLKLFYDEWRTPVFVEDVARVLLQIVLEVRAGIYHAAGPERLSRVEFGRALAQIRGSLSAQIVECSREDSSIIPPRPEDVSLNTTWTSAQLGYQFLSIKDGLRRSLR